MAKENLLNGRVLTISYFDPGEEITISHSLCADKFKQFLKDNINDDVDVIFEDIENDFKMELKTITVEENREAEIRGTMYGENCSRAQAIRIIDDLELLSDEDEEKELEKEYQENKDAIETMKSVK